MGLFFLLWNKTNVPIFFVSTEHGDRPCWPAGSADRPWGGWGPEPGLPEGCKAEALSQTKEVKRTRMVLLDSRWLFFFFSSLWRTDLQSPTRDKISSWVRFGVAMWHMATVPGLLPRWYLSEENYFCLFHPLSSCISLMKSVHICTYKMLLFSGPPT